VDVAIAFHGPARDERARAARDDERATSCVVHVSLTCSNVVNKSRTGHFAAIRLP
jgi:hypothetical protein